MRRPIGTFESEKAADAALARVLSDVYQGTYREHETGDVPLREYARRWLATRDLKPRGGGKFATTAHVRVIPRISAPACPLLVIVRATCTCRGTG